MRATCPSCGAGGSIELFLADVEWREAVLAAAKLPSDCAGPAMRYIGMFRPGKRYLTPDRTSRLLNEVTEMITNGADFDRQHIHAPSHVWRAALIDMLDAPNVKRPLKNHNYLLRIVQGKLGQQADTSASDRADSRRNDERVHVRSNKMQSVGEVLKADPVDDAYQALSKEERQLLLDQAEKELAAEKFAPMHRAALVMPRALDILRKRLGIEVVDGV